MTATEPDPNRWRGLAVCLVGGFMVLLDVSIVNVALPSIRLGLHAGQDELQWVLSGYALTFGLLLVPAGRVGDLRGRRNVFVVALALFTLASVACGAAPTALFLVVARLVQGLAGGLLTPQISAVIQELFQGRERATAFGWFGTVVGISTAIGPLLGGLLIQAFGDTEGWRAVFFVNLPVGLFAIPLAWRLLPSKPATKQTSHDFDPVGVVLLGAGAVVFLLPFVQEQQWHTPLKWLLVPAALLLIAAFIAWDRHYERSGREPLVDFALFTRRSYTLGSVLGLFFFAGFTPLFFVLTLYLQTGQGYPALLAGLSTIPFALGSVLSAFLGGRLIGRYGRLVVSVGLLITAIGFVAAYIAILEAPAHDTGWALVGPLLVAGIGSGFTISPNQTLTLSQVPVERAGTAGGLLQTGQRIGSAVGIAAVGAVFFARVASSGDYADAVRIGLVVAVGFVILALLASLLDLRRPGGSADRQHEGEGRAHDHGHAAEHRRHGSAPAPMPGG